MVFRDGRALQLCGEDDWRGRSWLGEKLAAMPESERWEYARLLALQCAANDFELEGRPSFSLDDKSPDPDYFSNFDALLAKVLELVPAKLSELWGKGALLHKTEEGERDNWMIRYRREKMSRHYSLLSRAVEYGHAPFADEGTPYDYRCFDLTRDEGGNAILFVDIHT